MIGFARETAMANLWRALGAWRAAAAMALTVLATVGAWAAAPSSMTEAPSRAGRLFDLQGPVWQWDDEAGQWADALRNRPLTAGDRLSTGDDGRAEVRIGSTVLRLGARTDLEFRRLDDDRMHFELHRGSVALAVRSAERAEEIMVVTAEASLRPLQVGHYRVDRFGERTRASVWRGRWRVMERDGAFDVEAGRMAELWREGPARSLRHAWLEPVDDGFGLWAQREAFEDERQQAAERRLPTEMTGHEDLDAHGRWDRHPELGVIWFPTRVAVDWVPYRHGRWVWVRPWGWTWVDDARWGFAPFHYGRWVHWNGRWGWVPGPHAVRPVYSPGLVAWVGSPGFSVSVRIGGPALPGVAWVPLSPWDTYHPPYRPRVPPPPPAVRPRPPHPQPGPHPHPRPSGDGAQDGPFNRDVPGAVTAVTRETFVRGQPIAPAVAEAGRIEWRPGSPERPYVPPEPPARREGRVTLPPSVSRPALPAAGEATREPSAADARGVAPGRPAFSATTTPTTPTAPGAGSPFPPATAATPVAPSPTTATPAPTVTSTSPMPSAVTPPRDASRVEPLRPELRRSEPPRPGVPLAPGEPSRAAPAPVAPAVVAPAPSLPPGMTPSRAEPVRAEPLRPAAPPVVVPPAPVPARVEPPRTEPRSEPRSPDPRSPPPRPRDPRAPADERDPPGAGRAPGPRQTER